MHYARWLRNGDPLALKPFGPEPQEPVACSVSGCNRPAKARTWCQTHYMRWKRYGDTEVVNPKGRPRQYEQELRTCESCGKEFVFTLNPNQPNRGLYCTRACANQAYKPKRHRKGTEHPNWRGGHVNRDGYRMIHREGRLVAEHRIVVEDHVGRALLPTETVHHRNGDKLDNRLENLELWSSRHSRGQRVEDLVAFAKEILELYG